MPAISNGVEMPESPIRKLAPLADAAKQRGVHVFHLNIGQPDLPTPQVAINAIRNIATTIEEGFSLPKVEKFEGIINECTRAILICNPNNPTGYLYTCCEMNQIRDLVKKYDLFLFFDEVYREFIYTGSLYISACHLEGIEQNVVLINSVFKRYSECGIRIDALITKNKEIRDAMMKFCQTRLSPPLVGQKKDLTRALFILPKALETYPGRI